MKALRFLRALPLALLLIAPARADQASIVGPTAGPKTMLEVMTAVNAGMLAIQSCNSGASAPSNGPGNAPKAYQCWADTSAAPVVGYKFYDGASWVVFGKLNTSTHAWTSVYQGSDTSTAAIATTGSSGHTLGFLDAANTWSGVQSFNSGMLTLKGSTSGAGTLNAPAAAASYAWTLPAITDTLVTKTSSDTFTNKSFDTASTGNSLKIAGNALLANTGVGSTVVLQTSPTLVTPTLGAATATSINGNVFVTGAGSLNLNTYTVAFGGAFSTAAAVTHAGAFATTITATAVSNATLPAGTQTLAGLGVAQTWTGAQSFTLNNLRLVGSTSGAMSINCAAACGSNTLTFPAGTTDFSTTGGAGQVVRQSSTGAPLTVSALAASNLTNGVSGSGQVLLDTSPTITTASLTNNTIFGVLNFGGSTSGNAVITAQPVAGTPTLALPNVSGTFAVGATSPLVLNTGSGNLTCPSCATLSGGTLPKSQGGLGATTLSSALDTEFSSTQGSLLYRNASAWVALAPGTAGQFLTTQGVAANPNWSSGGAGTGTVTNVGTAGLATGGPISASGTVTVTAASKSDQQTATSAVVAVTPSQQQSHPSAIKASAYFLYNGSAVVQGTSYNVGTVSRGGLGSYSIPFPTNFANTTYSCTFGLDFTAGGQAQNVRIASRTVSGIAITTTDNTYNPADTGGLSIQCSGNQ